MLYLDKVSKSFAGQPVLQAITLTVESAQVVGLAGSSGSGKSTLLRCIQGLEKPDSGSIETQVKTGFMFQDFQLFPHMTVLNNLIFAPSLHNTQEDHLQRAQQLLTQLGIADKANCYPRQLSGGQKQRVALARSLMMSPNLLLCDEPTSGLDVATITDVVTLLKSVQQMGIAMIIASHDLDFLTRMADSIVLLKQGHIISRIDPGSVDNPIAYLQDRY